MKGGLENLNEFTLAVGYRHRRQSFHFHLPSSLVPLRPGKNFFLFRTGNLQNFLDPRLDFYLPNGAGSGTFAKKSAFVI
jgi:hypothetical protein